MARIPQRLYGPAQQPNTVGTRYTVPAATKTIIRHIRISNPSGSAVTFTLSIGADAAGTRLYDAFSIPANSVRDDYWYVVMEAGQIIQTVASVNNVLVATINGDEIVLG